MSTVPVSRTTGAGWLVANIATITARNLHRLVRVPTLIAFATVQPIVVTIPTAVLRYRRSTAT